jgi:two-component system, chemotaxis family, chemotaxis protein CheY
MTDTSNLNIMIVDDQRTTRMLVRTSLRELGYRNVIECGDGEEALRVLGESPAQLIISDVNMPKMDGLALLKAVRAKDELKATPFIMLTGRGDVALVKEAIQIGVNGYLVKPFNLSALKQKVEAAIGAMARA